MYLTQFLDFGSTSSDNATNLALMDQETSIRVANTSGSLSTNLGNLYSIKNQLDLIMKFN